MNMWFNHFNNQQNQSNDSNYFENKQENWWEQFQKENQINKNETRADGNKTNRFDTNGTMNTNFKQTTYSVKDEGLEITANGTKWNGNKTRVNNNTIQYHDNQYGWCDIYAVNIDQVKEHGSGKASVYNSKLHGSIMEVKHKDGTVTNGIILDACGEARKKAIVDKWVYNQEKENEMVDWFIKRQGWDK